MRRTSLLFLALIISAGCINPAQAKQMMWRLEQVGTLGDINLCFTADAIRADVASRNLQIICKAPDWKVIMLNSKQKQILTQSLEEWKKHGLAWNANVTVGTNFAVNGSESKKTKLAGIEAEKFTCYEAKVAPNPAIRLLHIDQPPAFLRCEYIYKELPHSSANVTKFVKGLYSLPMAKDVPLAFTIYRVDGRHSKFYTKSVQSVVVPDSYFNCPCHYTECRDQWNFLVNQPKQNELEEITEGLGIGTSFGSGSAKKQATAASERR